MSNTKGLDMSNPDDAPDEGAAALAARLNMLMDYATSAGHTPTFREIHAAILSEGLTLSRARWAYMLTGSGPAVRDGELLDAISSFFRVDERYLRGELGDEIPEELQARIALVRAMRANRVKTFATRALADVSPQTLRAITDFLDADIVRSDEPGA